MVIRLSLNDPDYTALLKKFAKRLYVIILASHGVDTDSFEAMSKEYERCRRITAILNPESLTQPSNEDKGFISMQVRKAFSYFVSEHRRYDYLIDNLNVTVDDGMKDQNESDTAVYWFRRSGSVIVQ